MAENVEVFDLFRAFRVFRGQKEDFSHLSAKSLQFVARMYRRSRAGAAFREVFFRQDLQDEQDVTPNPVHPVKCLARPAWV